MDENREIDIGRLAEWFRTPLGQSLLARQRDIIGAGISRFFGYHQLEFLIAPDLGVAETSLLGHRIVAVPQTQPGLPESTVVSAAQEWPFDSDAIDLVVLHHTLDVSSNPHQTLREACRVLRSGGHLVIAGFNPYSLWGLRRRLERRPSEPWNLRFLAWLRLEDWLSLLDFRVRGLSMALAQPPLTNPRWLQRLGFMDRVLQRLKLPFGGFYVVIAQKRVGGMMPLREPWKRRAFAGVATVHQFTPMKRDEER